ncbi:MAG: penicillin acylase family protein [Bacteroidetes bacterium]|nr:penicillin acylase family protein [Bacteroidota bacterium]
MRIVPFLSSTAVTIALVALLNNPLGKVPPPGPFFSPQYGFWQNAEPINQDYNGTLTFDGLQGPVEVYFDDRLVPHVFASNEEDLYFVQGYLHARFRLFQIDLQTRAAAGRASELAGSKAINFDKEQRRLGMVFAAENALKEINADVKFRTLLDAYTAGINSYMDQLTEAALPIEYKLMQNKPEKWSNLKTALLLEMMSKMLSSGTENDLTSTNAKSIFMPEELQQLYPQVPDSLLPIVPIGTKFPNPSVVPIKPANADSLYFNNKATVQAQPLDRPDPNNGSNNWTVAGSKTKSGFPILANDPHLELSLPSIWFEIQLKTPTHNSYGVSLPGAPFVVIGFNDSIAWGVTNSQRDVKDYYEIKFKDQSRSAYWYNNQWVPTKIRIEEIKVKDSLSVYDTVAYTIFGPVQFDNSFSNAAAADRNLAVRWAAHDPSNEGLTFYKLNKAHNYLDYEDAIRTFTCPGQNFIFASRTGDIAIWQQGRFPARWEGQGLYVMPGQDSSFLWQGNIPQQENPHAINPARGYLQSANQRAADGTYPYFIPGSYITARGIRIDNKLSTMSNITPKDMMELHTDYFNVSAEDLRPVLLSAIEVEQLQGKELEYLEIFRNWDLMASPDSKGQTIFQCFWDTLQSSIWLDELSRSKPMATWPIERTTIEWLLRDTLHIYADDLNTPQRETLAMTVTSAFKKAASVLASKEAEGKLVWSRYLNPSIYHLLKDALPAFARKGLAVGGYGNVVNAIKHSHGPSWRMIVHLVDGIEAYGVFPGGQSGNPGSRFYDNNIAVWEKGEYNRCWYMHDGDRNNEQVKWMLKFNKP